MEGMLLSGRMLARAARMENGEEESGRKDQFPSKLFPLLSIEKVGKETLFILKLYTS